MPWYQNRKGESLWYEDLGSGRTVILLHGWCMSSAVWKYQFEYLSESLRVVAPDIRGHGRSSKVCTSLTFSNFAEDLVDLIMELKLSELLLVGWSMGAQIAMEAYADLSDRLLGLMLVSATPRFKASEDFSYGLADKDTSGMRLKLLRNRERALDGFYSLLFADGELENHPLAIDIKRVLSQIAPPDTTASIDALDSLARADMRGKLAGIASPALILNGALDQICSPEASTYLKNNIPSAQQVVFPESGHAPFLTSHIKFNQELLKFLRGICEQNY
ncbi:MAG: alpha/beta hydrolase [Desulfuromonadaceae bacterium]|nr:alpha/beta hydrolase [Desulfuromonadaceae bacterium]MDD2854084.1 alpha/beta hydrolase [Desulfuromonadaceae bacterium]